MPWKTYVGHQKGVEIISWVPYTDDYTLVEKNFKAYSCMERIPCSQAPA